MLYLELSWSCIGIWYWLFETNGVGNDGMDGMDGWNRAGEQSNDAARINGGGRPIGADQSGDRGKCNDLPRGSAEVKWLLHWSLAERHVGLG